MPWRYPPPITRVDGKHAKDLIKRVYVGGSGFGKELVEIGLLQVGDAVGFFKADSVVEPGCHIILGTVQYIVNLVSEKY